MISQISGVIVDKGKDLVVLETLGMGFSVYVPESVATSAGIGDRQKLFTRLVVREDNWSLYGFLAKEERACFDLLLGVRGVGSRVAMAVVSGLGPDDFYRAVVAEDERGLIGIPGVGKKTAGRIILELRDKIGLGAHADAGARRRARRDPREEAVDALLALGYSWQEARDALANISLEEYGDLESVLREALRRLARL